MVELSTKQKGDISELEAMAELTRLGADVYCPYGEDTRSDLIAEIDGELIKIQVKTAHSEDGKIEFKCCSTRSNFSETTEHSYEGEIDAFIVFHPKSDSLYYVPIADAPKTSMYLRLEPTKNNQTKGINMASDYELAKRLK